MSDSCLRCQAELGPWEGENGSTCLKCAGGARTSISLLKLGARNGTSHRDVGWTLADMGVLALERADGPLTVYDIARLVHSEYGHEVQQNSLAVAMSNDHRFCWAGKGLYGLYRHGLYPGMRTLGGVAILYLYAAARPIDGELLAFAMKQSGYRFQTQSLLIAASRESAVVVEDGMYSVPQSDWRRRWLREQGVGPRDVEVERVLARCRTHVKNAATEFEERRAEAARFNELTTRAAEHEALIGLLDRPDLPQDLKVQLKEFLIKVGALRGPADHQPV